MTHAFPRLPVCNRSRALGLNSNRFCGCSYCMYRKGGAEEKLRTTQSRRHSRSVGGTNPVAGNGCHVRKHATQPKLVSCLTLSPLRNRWPASYGVHCWAALLKSPSSTPPNDARCHGCKSLATAPHTPPKLQIAVHPRQGLVRQRGCIRNHGFRRDIHRPLLCCVQLASRVHKRNYLQGFRIPLIYKQILHM